MQAAVGSRLASYSEDWRKFLQSNDVSPIKKVKNMKGNKVFRASFYQQKGFYLNFKTKLIGVGVRASYGRRVPGVEFNVPILQNPKKIEYVYSPGCLN